MASNLTEFVTMLEARVADLDNRLTPEQKKSFVLQAVDEHSNFDPRRMIYQAIGDGGFDYALPPDFLRYGSSIDAIEHPLDDNAGTPTENQDSERYIIPRSSWNLREIERRRRLGPDIGPDAGTGFAFTATTITRADGGNWATDGFVVGDHIKVSFAGDPENDGTHGPISAVDDAVDGAVTIPTAEFTVNAADTTAVFNRDPNSLRLRFTDRSPSTSEWFRVYYTTVHVVSDDPDISTIPPEDEEAVADLAASKAHLRLASVYAGTSDTTANADVVNFRSKSDEHMRLATAYDASWRRHMGIDKAGRAAIRPASRMVNWNLDLANGDRRILHRRRWR